MMAELEGRRVGAAGSGTSARALRGIVGAKQVALGKGQAGVPSLEKRRHRRAHRRRVRRGGHGPGFAGPIARSPPADSTRTLRVRPPPGRDDLKRALDLALEELEREGRVHALRVQFGVERGEDWPVAIEAGTPGSLR